MVQVYSEPLCRRHYASLFGEAALFRIALFCIAVAVSLVVAFATGGFWVKVKPTLSQPSVHFTNDALLIFEGSVPGQEQVWSTSPVLNAQFQSNLAAASVEVGEDDYNFDGKPDAINFIATVASNVPVHGVKALLQFTYNFEGNIQLQMYSFAYFSYTSHLPGGSLYADGELILQQQSPITDRKYNGMYNMPMMNSSNPNLVTALEVSNSLDVQGMMQSYLGRNYTTLFTNVQPVWKASSGTEFTLHMKIRIPPNQVVWYRPQVIEQLKFGWIQFLATYIVLWWIFGWLKMFVFRYRLFTTHVMSDVQQRTQKW